ncbi:tyrosine-protein phosphatase [Salinicoccus sp. CNSTN-B1]
MIDVHNHILIDVDDGPQNEAEAVSLLKQAADSGITDIITTPHHHNRDFVTPRSKVLEKLDEINKVIQNHQLDIRVHPGQEIRVNGNMLEEFKSDINITLNESRYVLIELSFNEVPNYVEPLLYDLQMNGYTPLIAHPERCKPIIRKPEILFSLIEKGAISQVTAGSITGDLGENLKQTALKMIKNNLVHILASDAHHAELRPFRLKEAYEIIEEELGKEYTQLLQSNATSILLNKDVRVRQPKPIKTHYNQSKTKHKKKFFGLF